jgi:hypothetical protein
MNEHESYLYSIHLGSLGSQSYTYIHASIYKHQVVLLVFFFLSVLLALFIKWSDHYHHFLCFVLWISTSFFSILDCATIYKWPTPIKPSTNKYVCECECECVCFFEGYWDDRGDQDDKYVYILLGQFTLLTMDQLSACCPGFKKSLQIKRCMGQF